MITMRQRTVPASRPCCLPQLLDFSASLTVSQLLNRVSVRLISSCQLSLFSACFHFLSFPPLCLLPPPLRQLLCLSLSVQEIRTQCPARHFYWTDNSAASPRNHEMKSSLAVKRQFLLMPLLLLLNQLLLLLLPSVHHLFPFQLDHLLPRPALLSPLHQ